MKTKDEAQSGLNAPNCFVIMPISDHPDYPAGHFSRVYAELIKPAVEDAGFKCKRVDDDVETKVIILSILKMVTEFDMAICDLSSLNPNVMYELGIRQMAKMPVTLIKDERTKRIFDVSLMSDIQYDSSLRVDLVRLAKRAISDSVRLTYESRDSNTNSLLDSLGVKLKIEEKEISISKSEELILDRLNSLSIQISSFQNSGGAVTNPEILDKGRPIDKFGKEINMRDVLYDEGKNIFYVVLGIRTSTDNIRKEVLLTLSLHDLKGGRFFSKQYNSLNVPLLKIDENLLQANNPDIYNKFILFTRAAIASTSKPKSA